MIQSTGIQPKSFGIATSDSAVSDAFSRLRVSTPQTTLDVQNQYNAETLRMESGNTGTGAVPTWAATHRMVALQVGAGGAGGTSFVQSFQYIPYQPGKSQMILMTGVLGAGTAGAVKRFGYGDAANGIFYEQNGVGGLQFNRRTSTSGVVVDNPVTQANWNLDRFDGTGPSGVTINPNNCFILVIDLQFLGMGRIRVGFDVNGVIYYAHQFLNANVLLVPYMQTATLPVMAEIVASAAIGSVASAFFKCAAVVSEGGLNLEVGRNFSTSTQAAATTARFHALSLRPSLLFNGITNRGLFILESIDILAGTNPVLFEIVIGAAFTVNPAFAANNSTYSFMDVGTGGTFNNLTNGVVIFSGYVPTGAGSARAQSSSDLAISYPITLDRSGAVRALGTMSVLLSPTTGNSTCNVALNWREIR